MGVFPYNHPTLASPNLLKVNVPPTKKSAIKRQDGLIIEQWVKSNSDRMAPVNGAGVYTGSRLKANYLEVDAATTYDGLVFDGKLQHTITDYPYGVFASWQMNDTVPVVGDVLGIVGIYNGLTAGTGQRCYFGTRAFKGRVAYVQAKSQFSTTLDMNIGSYWGTWSIGDKFVMAAVSLSATDHRIYALHDGEIRSGSSATDLSAWSLIKFNSISFGATYQETPIRLGYAQKVNIYTGGVFSGPGVTESVILRLIRNPYKYLRAV